MVLTERQLLILQIIIDDFIRSAQPVGSRTLAKKSEITFSSATIRNEMADLEDLGYIEKTHSSSGRVPSEKGYRYYVDHLLAPSTQILTEVDILAMRSVFAERMYGLEKLVKRSAKILSELTNYTSIVLGPLVNETKLRSIQMLPLDDDTVLSLIVTDKGHVEKSVVKIPTPLDKTELERFVATLNARLIGVPLVELKTRMYEEVNDVIHSKIENYASILETIVSNMNKNEKSSLIVSGKTNMLSQPEFNDIDKVRAFMRAIDKEADFYNVLRKNQQGVHVTIGHENELHGIKDCSLITATYTNNGEPLGTIAILGPTRMEYSRVISMLNLLANEFSQWHEKQ